ncbi:MAG: hypothetical protein GTO63_23610 [Anaerolineae bacterium]|nr:hypothetical protein [Anaerolineae bacterium]NIN97712.1 hypothetical protein [Anaerolineae bacterium]NIQ80699.1 hypothetical protein [Anaerolineae bacterium]
MQVIFVLIAVAIFVDIVILTLVAMKVGRSAEKLEMFCETFEQMAKNILEEHLKAVSKISGSCEASEDHLKTINKNVYLMAKQLMGKDQKDGNE